MRDYHRSNQIKNRISHFKTEHNNKVVLKMDKYIGRSSSSKSEASLMANPNKLILSSSKDSLNGEEMRSHKINKELITAKLSKMNSNVASHYRKDEILRNKIKNSNKLFTVTKDKRIKVLSMLEESRRAKKQAFNQR